MFRHKIRVGKSIEEVGDAKKREEFEKIEIEAKDCISIPYKSESPEEVSVSVKWMKAHVRMLLVRVLKKLYMHQACTREELDKIEEDLNNMEMKLSEEPDSQVKVDIYEEIRGLRELLLSM